MIPLLLIRHGKTSWNLEKRLQGRRDIPLSDEGRKILQELSLPEEFSEFDWVSSPLIRAQQTAKLLGARDLMIEDQLIEMDWGTWEGKTLPELRAEFGDAIAQNEARGLDMTPPGGESPRDVQKRVLPFLKTLTRPTIAVSHKGVIRAIKALAYGWDMTDKSPVRFDWNAAHLFMIDAAGQPTATRVNMTLEQ